MTATWEALVREQPVVAIYGLLPHLYPVCVAGGRLKLSAEGRSIEEFGIEHPPAAAKIGTTVNFLLRVRQPRDGLDDLLSYLKVAAEVSDKAAVPVMDGRTFPAVFAVGCCVDCTSPESLTAAGAAQELEGFAKLLAACREELDYVLPACHASPGCFRQSLVTGLLASGLNRVVETLRRVGEENVESEASDGDPPPPAPSNNRSVKRKSEGAVEPKEEGPVRASIRETPEPADPDSPGRVLPDLPEGAPADFPRDWPFRPHEDALMAPHAAYMWRLASDIFDSFRFEKCVPEGSSTRGWAPGEIVCPHTQFRFQVPNPPGVFKYQPPLRTLELPDSDGVEYFPERRLETWATLLLPVPVAFLLIANDKHNRRARSGRKDRARLSESDLARLQGMEYGIADLERFGGSARRVVEEVLREGYVHGGRRWPLAVDLVELLWAVCTLSKARWGVSAIRGDPGFGLDRPDGRRSPLLRSPSTRGSDMSSGGGASAGAGSRRSPASEEEVAEMRAELAESKLQLGRMEARLKAVEDLCERLALLGPGVAPGAASPAILVASTPTFDPSLPPPSWPSPSASFHEAQGALSSGESPCASSRELFGTPLDEGPGSDSDE